MDEKRRQAIGTAEMLRDEAGQSTVEFIVSLLFLVGFLLFAATAADVAYMKIVANQAARVAARAAVYGWDSEAVNRATDVVRMNPAILPATRLRNADPEVLVQDQTASGVVGVLRRLNMRCDVTVNLYVPVPLVTGNQIFDRDEQIEIKVSSTCAVNRWNGAVLFYVPVRVD